MKKSFLIPVVFFLVGCSSFKPYFFVHITDPQLGMIENNAGFSQESLSVANTFSAINRLKPAFVVITGDLVNQTGNEDQIMEFKRLLGQIKKSIPVYYVPGNHDVGQTAADESLALYRQNFKYDRFSVLRNNTRLIGFNSQLIQAKRDTLEKEQYLRIENELKNAGKYKYRLVFAHHPLFLQTIDEKDTYQNIPAEYRSKYLELFRKYKVRYLFVGHLHKNHLLKTGNLTIIATNSVSVSHSSEPPGLRIVKVYPDSIVHEYFSMETLPVKIDL